MERRSGGRVLIFMRTYMCQIQLVTFYALIAFILSVVKCHSYKLHVVDKERGSSVVKSFHRVASLSGSHN